MSAIPPAYVPPLEWIENPAGVLLPYRPKIQFAGSAVASIADDAVHNRTVVTLNGGGGGGGSVPLTTHLTIPPIAGFANLPNIDLTVATVDWDDIGINVVAFGGPGNSFVCLPKGYYIARLTLGLQDDTPTPQTDILRYTAFMQALQSGGHAPGGPSTESVSSSSTPMTVDDSGAAPTYFCVTHSWESGDTDIGTEFGLGHVAFSVMAVGCGIYNLTTDHDVSGDGAGFGQLYLYITQLAPKA